MDQVNLVLDTVRTYLVEIGSFLPKLTGALIVLVLGWLVAKALRWVIVRGLHLARFDVVTGKAGIDGLLKRGGARKTTERQRAQHR